MTLAHAGLLDRRTATAHWGDLSRLEEAYPRVRWIRGVRWIDHGPIVMSAGLTSGIDASLHVIRSDSIRLEGSAVPWRTIGFPLLLGAIGFAIAATLARAARAARTLDRAASPAHAVLPMSSHRLHSEA